VTPTPQHGTPAGDAALAISKLARDTGQDVQDLQTIYALEGLLARLAASPYRDDFVLKGGVLLAAYALRRPTKDIDLQATRLSNDVEEVAERVRQIASVDLEDGLVFDLAGVRAAIIREGDDYEGVRVKLGCSLGKSRVKIGVDVNFGDPVWPKPGRIELPRLVDVGRGPVELWGYPLTMALAEKIVTMLQRGEANTRWRDFGDVYLLAQHRSVSADDLLGSLRTVADYRGHPLTTLLPRLAQMPEVAQPKWAAWLRRSGRSELPEQFSSLLARIAAFADPVLGGEGEGGTWSPENGQWLDVQEI
jgi:predicted nucleotidyltransferase component of viral defense system